MPRRLTEGEYGLGAPELCGPFDEESLVVDSQHKTNKDAIPCWSHGACNQNTPTSFTVRAEM